ncbi:MAG TPA: hypothetical protein VH331_15550 [Allosphingosinicella sp.]|jgi:hypothetical protein|nr:hypothetical protein [Allosphingosinicella sp.]
MDLGFFRRAEALLASRSAARLDVGVLVATLHLQQAASAGAQAQAIGEALPCPEDPLAELLSAGPAWRQAAAALHGCFNPALARKGAVN